MKKCGWPIAPLILGFILGPLLEQHFRASLQGSGGPVLILMSRRLWSKVSVQEGEAGDAK